MASKSAKRRRLLQGKAPLIIDLCSGIGRWQTATQVIRIDLDPKTKPDIVADVRAIPLRALLRPQLLHASPPCKYLTRARQWEPTGVAESLRIVAAIFDEINRQQPHMWTIENPVGRLSRILHPDVTTIYRAYDMPMKRTAFWSSNRSLRRSIIPSDVRQAMLGMSRKRGLEKSP